MTIIYMDRDMRLKEPAAGQQADRDAFCPGARVGEVIDTAKNPLLWERRSKPPSGLFPAQD